MNEESSQSNIALSDMLVQANNSNYGAGNLSHALLDDSVSENFSGIFKLRRKYVQSSLSGFWKQ